MRKMRWIAAALIACGALCAQERGTPVFGDNFDVKGTFIENWKPTAGVKNENGVVMLPAAGGRIFMRRKMPEEFYATVRLKLSQPDPDPKKRGGFAGFSIAGRVFVIRQDGKAWMVYKIPGQKRSGGAIQKIANFEFGKFYTLTLIRKPVGTDKSSSQWIYLVDDKMIGQAVITGISENAQLSMFTYRTGAELDDFQISELKEEGGNSPNMAVNSSFEHTQEGIPIYFDTETLRGYNRKAPYEKFLKTFQTDTEVKHSGKQSLRLIFDDTCGKQGFQTWDTGMVVGQPMMYSIYLKADQDDFPVRMSIWEMRTKWHFKDIKLSKEWQRFEFPLASASRSTVRCGIQFTKPGTVWADDVQIEIGDKATAYMPSSLDKRKFAAKKNGFAALPPVTAAKLDKVPLMDGNLDAWKDGARETGKFYFKNGTPKNNTRAWLGCDADNLYIGIRAYVKDLSKIKAKAGAHDDFKLFGQDNIEILLDPGRSRTRYYQLAVSAAGGRVDLGLGRNPNWNGDWSAAVRRNEKESSIDYEIKLPFSSFTAADAGGDWGINIGRLDTESGEASALMPNDEPNFHKPAGYPQLVIPADILRKYALGVTVSRVLETNGKYQLAGIIRNNTGTEIKGLLHAAAAKDGRRLGSAELLLKKGENAFSMECLPLEKNAEVVFTLESGAEKRFIALLRPEKFSPVTIRGKYNYYMKEPEAEFRVLCSLKHADRMTAELSVAGKKITAKAQERFTLKVPLSDIPDGVHPAVLTLSMDGSAAARVQTVLVKKPYQKGAVQINRFRRCLASEGKNIFLFMPLLYIARWTKEPEKSLEFYANYGFKSIMVGVGHNMLKSAASVIGKAKEHGIKVLYWNHWRDWKKWKNTTWEQQEAEIRRLSKLDNILAQLVIDEPELYMNSDDARRELTKMRAYFPYHPVQMNNTVIGIPNRFADLNTDILMLDDYLTNKEGRTVREIVDQADIMWKAGAAECKPCFYFLAGNNTHNHYREPSAAEQYAQTYGAIAANCTGLAYFMGCPTYPAGWKAYLALNREILSLNDVILSDEETPDAAVSDATLRHITRKHNGYLYVIAVNIDDRAADGVTVTLPAGSRYADQAEVEFENRKIQIKDGRFTDSFPALSRHVYKVKIIE